MKNRPPCCGLWFPCARSAYVFVFGDPSGQVPGATASSVPPLQVHDTAAVTCTSGGPSIGPRPGAARTMVSGLVPHVHTASRRIGTRSILQVGQVPFLTSRI